MTSEYKRLDIEHKCQMPINTFNWYHVVNFINNDYQIRVGRVDGRRVYFKERVIIGQLEESTTYTSLSKLLKSIRV